MSEIVSLDFEGDGLRVIMIEEPLWLGRDVCRVLDIKNSRDALARLDEDLKIKSTVDLNDGRGPREATFVNEVGLYELILTSYKPNARVFKRWALEKIRDLRRYGVAFANDDSAGTLAAAHAAERRGIETLDDYTSVSGWLSLNGIRLGRHAYNWMGHIGRRACAICRERGIYIWPVPGAPNMYPMEIIAEAYWDVIPGLTGNKGPRELED